MTGWPALIRVQVPDRPGALGLIASRIGAIKADIVSIEVLERREGVALDLLAVVLPDESLSAALTREIHEVDGAAVVSIVPVPGFAARRSEPLASAIALARAGSIPALASELAASIAEHLSARWSIVIGPALVIGFPDLGTADVDQMIDAATFSAPVGTDAVTMYLARDIEVTPEERHLAQSLCDLAGALWERTG